MTTYCHVAGYLYSDSRIYVSGEPFNASGKVTPIPYPIKMKMRIQGNEIEDTIYGFFSTQNVAGARALFNKILASAQMRDGEVQDVIDHHLKFIEDMGLAATDTCFSLYLIGETKWYTINTPWVPNQAGFCKIGDLGAPEELRATAVGANSEYLVELVGAGYPVLKAYHAMFAKFPESGGAIEVWKIARRDGIRKLVRHEFYNAIPDETLKKITDPDNFLNWESPYPDLVDPTQGWLSSYNCSRLKDYLEKKGYVLDISESGLFRAIKAPDGRRFVKLPK